jgi:hypothetical protein
MSGRQNATLLPLSILGQYTDVHERNKYIRNSYIYSMPKSKQDLIDEYLRSLDEMELIAYNIAKSHLGTLFSVEKSNHYLEWYKAQSA